jgi:hypothetical protein
VASTRTRASSTGLLGADASECAKPLLGCISKVAMAGERGDGGRKVDQRMDVLEDKEAMRDKRL